MQFLFSLFIMYINCLQLTNAQVEDGNLSRANLVLYHLKNFPLTGRCIGRRKTLLHPSSSVWEKENKVDVNLCSKEHVRKLTYCAIPRVLGFILWSHWQTQSEKRVAWLTFVSVCMCVWVLVCPTQKTVALIPFKGTQRPKRKFCFNYTFRGPSS